MSENIQSIANGSFVLGNTNELTFSAGPGISITQPSEGVVRIGNDETVLWSATANNQYSASLSEPYSAFERVRVEFIAGDTRTVNRTVYNEFPGYVTQFNLIGQRTDNGGVVFTVSDLSGSDGYTKLTPTLGRYIVVPKSTTALAVGSINIALNSIVGINRISGGNE